MKPRPHLVLSDTYGIPDGMHFGGRCITSHINGWLPYIIPYGHGDKRARKRLKRLAKNIKEVKASGRRYSERKRTVDNPVHAEQSGECAGIGGDYHCVWKTLPWYRVDWGKVLSSRQPQGAAYIRARLHVVSAYPVIDRSPRLAVAFSKRFTYCMALADALPIVWHWQTLYLLHGIGKRFTYCMVLADAFLIYAFGRRIGKFSPHDVSSDSISALLKKQYNKQPKKSPSNNRKKRLQMTENMSVCFAIKNKYCNFVLKINMLCQNTNEE